MIPHPMGKVDHTGTCKMCGTTATLRFSHIVPELCYLATYDAKHRASKVTSDSKRHLPLQKGIREYLLCDVCEGRLSKIEGAFKEYWYGTPALPDVVAARVQVLTGFTYHLFKLFHLSILWREGVSTLPEFDTINLGPYADKIRKMLLACDAGPTDHYPIFGLVLVDEDGRVVYELVTKPQVSKWGGIHTYYMCYAGCEWYIVLTDHIHGDLAQVLPAVPQPEGTMHLLTQDWRESGSVRAFVEDRWRHTRRRLPPFP